VNKKETVKKKKILDQSVKCH